MRNCSNSLQEEPHLFSKMFCNHLEHSQDEFQQDHWVFCKTKRFGSTFELMCEQQQTSSLALVHKCSNVVFTYSFHSKCYFFKIKVIWFHPLNWYYIFNSVFFFFFSINAYISIKLQVFPQWKCKWCHSQLWDQLLTLLQQWAWQQLWLVRENSLLKSVDITPFNHLPIKANMVWKKL